MWKHYVLGFGFCTTPEGMKVALIQKQKPEWQKGRWNGIGGKLEPTDLTIAHGMSREFYEETGVRIPHLDWAYRMRIKNDTLKWRVDVWSTIHDMVRDVQTIEEERVELFDLSEALSFRVPLIQNLHWMIPLCLDKDISGPVKMDDVGENG